MSAIFQSSLPEPMRQPRPLPGIAPLAMEDWIWVDDAYSAQMAERVRLLRARRSDVVGMLPEARPAADELLDFVLAHIARVPTLGFVPEAGAMRRPDGVRVPVDREDPLGTLGRLLQNDLCLLEKRGEEHVLIGAVLCFPASWTLAEKLGRPLLRIHKPVAHYEADVARRVQRLLDGVQVGRPLWRSNLLRYTKPDLFAPRRESEPPSAHPEDAPFIRAERQVLLRLPETRAVVFSIHTFVTRAAAAQV